MRPDTPDAVARALLELRGTDWTLDPAGSGTVLDLSGLCVVRSIEVESAIVWAEAGATWGAVEAALVPRALTLGPIPVWLRDRSIAQTFADDGRLRPSPRYGQLTDALLSVRAALPDGRLTRSSVAPRRAVGPDLARCLFGSGHRAGVLTDVRLQAWPRARSATHRVRAYPDWRAGLDAAVEVLRAGVRPAWWRLARGRGDVRLIAELVDERGVDEPTRFDAVAGGEDRDGADAVAAVFHSDARPQTLQAIFTGTRAAVAERAEATAGAQLWDLRPEGATLYTSRGATPEADPAWRDLAATVIAALEGHR